jgi:O-antigen ligase
MRFTTTRYRDYFFYLILFTLISLWNIPHTIALRYVCEGVLLLVILSSSFDWKPILARSKLLLIFALYLLIHVLFFSSSISEGLKGFKSEWMHFILFTIVGAGSGLYLAQKKSQNLLLLIGLAFAVPLLIHLSLVLYKGIAMGSMPWDYWGINQIHGDLAYASLQASILLTVYVLSIAKTRLQYTLSTLLLLACFVSPLIAQSRGGVIFVIGSVFFTSAWYFYFKRPKLILHARTILISAITLVCLGFLIKTGIAVDPERWGRSVSRALAGFQGDANVIMCNGVESLIASYHSKKIPITPQIESELDRILNGEGTRVMAARSGLNLVLQHPMGIDGSKQAYQIAIKQFCGGVPAIVIFHAHNGWIDTALAIGIPGALLLFMVMINYGVQGFRLNREPASFNPFALALFASACLWLLRALLDSTLRDQMLEMQAFVLPLLLTLAMAYHSKLRTTK